jgi:ABC-type sugar transport system ATPase subunit
MAAIQLKNVVKSYRTGKSALQVIHGVNAEVADREFVVIVGPSGCGKSTLLRMVASGDTGNDWNVVMATALLAMLPPAAVVILMQRWFVKGLVDTEK